MTEGITAEEQANIAAGVNEVAQERLASMTREELLSFALIACSRVGMLMQANELEPSADNVVACLKVGAASCFVAYDIAKAAAKPNEITAKMAILSPGSNTMQ